MVQSQDPDVCLISQTDIVMCFIYNMLVMSWRYRGWCHSNIVRISECPLGHYQKAEKINFLHKSHWGSRSSCGSSLIELSTGATVIVFSLVFSLIGFSLGSSVLGSSLSSQWQSLLQSLQSSSSMLFFRHVAIFYQIVLLFSLSKTDVLFLHSSYSQKQLVGRVY